MSTAPLEAAASELDVHRAVASVDDPEYPSISIVDLGLLERLEIDADGAVTIGLVPTFTGCPALAVIAEDVERAVGSVPGVHSVTVDWLTSPLWSIDRVSDDARRALAERFTVAVQIGRDPVNCPRCGEPTIEQSMFGPSRCRSVHRCPTCSETVEVMRG
ncbi:MAG: metal-sulfur cluster assembly factor [Acidimicrobiia bacterium]|nr:metal-sulfur cluster assembly factor [Acidimicrobiia bacterium]